MLKSFLYFKTAVPNIGTLCLETYSLEQFWGEENVSRRFKL